MLLNACNEYAQIKTSTGCGVLCSICRPVEQQVINDNSSYTDTHTYTASETVTLLYKLAVDI